MSETLHEVFEALCNSQEVLIAATQILGEIESSGPHASLPYRLKDLKIKIDLQIITNHLALKNNA